MDESEKSPLLSDSEEIFSSAIVSSPKILQNEEHAISDPLFVTESELGKKRSKLSTNNEFGVAASNAIPGKGRQQRRSILVAEDCTEINVTVKLEEDENINLTWSAVNVFVKENSEKNCFDCCPKKQKYQPKGPKQILKDVLAKLPQPLTHDDDEVTSDTGWIFGVLASGVAKGGQLLAIMGGSGAGKTTMLNVLTQRNLANLKVEGNVQLNGENVTPGIMRSISAYVQQDDLFIGTLRVREHLMFQALLRMGKSCSYKQRVSRVNDVISEILTDPRLLFCDEPTSGLDSFMAQQVIAVLKNMARKGKTIVCTIHQPSSPVFAMFDQLCLMAEGRITYLGPAKAAAKLFERYKATWWQQARALVWRSLLGNIREPLLLQVRLYQTIVISIILGLVYFNTKLSADTIMNVNGILFLFVTNMTFQYIFPVVNLPQYIALPLIFTTILYWMAGLCTDAGVFFTLCGLNVLSANVAISLGYMISCITGDVNVGLSVTPVVVIPLLLFGGFYLNADSVPVYFIWLKYLSYFKYSYEAVAVNQWRTVVQIPGCINGTCPENGQEVLQMLSFREENFGLDVVVLGIMLVGIRFIGFVCLLLRTYLKK